MTDTERLSKVYSTAKWRKLRGMVRQAGFDRCVQCGAPSQVLDHIKPVQLFPALAFDPRNVQPLCRVHHTEKTATIDAPNGNPGLYRYDLAHQADLRPEALRRWARDFVASGMAGRLIGDPALGSPKLNKLKGWTPAC